MPLILFDFDGVLADTLEDMIRFAQEACNELGVHHTVVYDDLRNLEVMSFGTFGRACGVPENLVEKFVLECTGKFAGKKTPPEIFDGLPGVIRKLSGKNLLVVITGNTTANVNNFLVHHKLQGCFRKIYGVDMPGSKAEKILMAKNQFRAGDEAVFFVGDSLSDISSAREANVISIAVGWGHQGLDMLTSGEPDLMVHSPAELLEMLD